MSKPLTLDGLVAELGCIEKAGTTNTGLQNLEAQIASRLIDLIKTKGILIQLKNTQGAK